MKRRIDLTVLIGISLFLFGLISMSYGIITVTINLFFGYLGIFLYVKDVLFDIVFLLLGLLLIRRNKKINSKSRLGFRKDRSYRVSRQELRNKS
ncbi:hypothetical protein LCGC14_0682010 [marine sediment metagenome]|uniref:Uncharacterized protein n=1 Tax=marine sediment metagenome TaxID=412755 RepID=A0A0F9TW09_9ZZZZ